MSDSAQRDSSPRAADTDRIQTAHLLTDAAAQGQLDLSEYESRLNRAYSAETYDELARLSSDLPSIANTRRGACKPAPSSTLLAILGAFQRRGRWNVPQKLTTFALWGGGVVDLRYADFTSPDVSIRAYSVMGGQTILLPPEVNVEVDGSAVMGNFEHEVNEEGTPGAPRVRIKGLALWGNVGIKRKRRRRQDPSA